MSFLYTRRNITYGVSNALQAIAPQTIVAKRAPGVHDIAELGTIWVNKSGNQAYICNSVVANVATWGPLTLNSGQTIAAGNLVVAAGNATVSGTVTGTTAIVSGGSILAGSTVTAVTSIAAGTTITAGTGLRATTGGLTVSAGGATITAGGLTVTAGGATVAAGDITATAGKVIAGTVLRASGDTAGLAATVSISNAVNTTQSTGALTLLSANANSGTNAGFLKVYIGTAIAYVPYFTNITP